MSATETAIVVGASGAMGQVIARRLADQGLRVLAVARTRESVAALAGSHDRIEACPADLSQDESIDVLASAIGTQTVRALVHGPGVATAGGVLNAPTAAVVDAVNIKVGGMMRLVRAADARLVRGSRLIAIGGHYGFEPSAYAATAGVCNAALANLIRQYSWDYGERGVTAHLVAPGPADTDRLRRVAGARAEREGGTVDAVLDEMKQESAIRAFTTVEQIAWAIQMLLAPEADAMAGGTLFMDAGRRKGLP